MAILDTGLVFSASLDRTLRTWRLDTFTGGESRYYIDTIDIIDTYTLHTCTGGQYVEYTSFVTAPTLKMPNVHVTFNFIFFYNLIPSSELPIKEEMSLSSHYLRIISTTYTPLQEAARWTAWRTTLTMCSASAWRRAGWPPGARGTRRYTSTDTPGRYLHI